MSSIREELTPSQRATPLKHTIDPGFVHHRKIQTILGPNGMSLVDELIALLPQLPDWQRQIRIDQIYTQIMLFYCNLNRVKPLEEILATHHEQKCIFCSTETLAPCHNISDVERAISLWVPRGSYNKRVEFHYSTRHIYSDTLRSELRKGANISIIAELYYENYEVMVFHPIIMGFPWLVVGDTQPDFGIKWFGHDFFENFIEDFDEFSRVRDIPMPPTPEPMRYVSERAFKECLKRILGDSTSKDWGGENSDYFTAHLHLNQQRVTAAFLLKGPAHFAPMSLNHLGKNNDQIVRLAREPAQLLFIQHTHDILPPVRATLRAFAVQPSNPRRYCLIDGRDSLRLLQAYELYNWASSFPRRGKLPA